MLVPKPRIQTYEEFWPFYLKEHSRKETRRWHFAGTALSLSLLSYFLVSGRWLWIPLAFLPGYSFAWYSHFFIEHNRPATFKYPFWSFISDFRMAFWMILGKL